MNENDFGLPPPRKPKRKAEVPEKEQHGPKHQPYHRQCPTNMMAYEDEELMPFSKTTGEWQNYLLKDPEYDPWVDSTREDPEEEQ